MTRTCVIRHMAKCKCKSTSNSTKVGMNITFINCKVSFILHDRSFLDLWLQGPNESKRAHTTPHNCKDTHLTLHYTLPHITLHCSIISDRIIHWVWLCWQGGWLHGLFIVCALCVCLYIMKLGEDWLVCWLSHCSVQLRLIKRERFVLVCFD